MALYHQPVDNTDGTRVEHDRQYRLNRRTSEWTRHSGHGKGPGVIPTSLNIMFNRGKPVSEMGVTGPTSVADLHQSSAKLTEEVKYPPPFFLPPWSLG